MLLPTNFTHVHEPVALPKAGSAMTNGREPKSCLGQVFNSKLGHIATLGSKCMVCMQPLLKLETRPRARPVSLSLSMHNVAKAIMAGIFVAQNCCQF